MKGFEELEKTLDNAIKQMRALKSKTVLTLSEEEVRGLESFIMDGIIKEQHREKTLVSGNEARRSKERQRRGHDLLNLIQEAK